jgi:cell division protein YceG involved in septum cleavage
MNFLTFDTYNIYAVFTLIFVIVFIISLIGFFLFLKNNYFFKENRKISKIFLIINAISIILISTFNNISNDLLKSEQIKNSKTISLQLHLKDKFSDIELEKLIKKIKTVQVDDLKIIDVQIIEENSKK